MKELRDILDAYTRLAERGEAGVLASVAHVAGSTYRRPGARMLVLPDDTMVGLISGGCLEGDLLEHARRVRETGVPALVQYDHRGQDDIVWGLGLGCAGAVDVWLERVDARSPGPLRWLEAWSHARESGAIATALSGPRAGERRALTGRGELLGKLAAPEVDAASFQLEVGGLVSGDDLDDLPRDTTQRSLQRILHVRHVRLALPTVVTTAVVFHTQRNSHRNIPINNPASAANMKISKPCSRFNCNSNTSDCCRTSRSNSCRKSPSECSFKLFMVFSA